MKATQVERTAPAVVEVVAVLAVEEAAALAVEEVVVGALAAAEGFVPNPKTEDCADDVVVF